MSDGADWKRDFPPADWQSEDVLLYCGDCLEILPKFPSGSVDAVVTDPPYGVGKAKWDDAFPSSWFFEIPRIAPPCDARWIILTRAGESMRDAINLMGGSFQSTAVAWLSNGMTRGRVSWGNWIAVNLGGSFSWQPVQDVFRVVVDTREPIDHPCPKPIACMQYICRTYVEGLVCDPFMGSGTTGVACIQTGRKFIGIEIDEGYFAFAVKRIERAIKDEAGKFAFARVNRNNGSGTHMQNLFEPAGRGADG